MPMYSRFLYLQLKFFFVILDSYVVVLRSYKQHKVIQNMRCIQTRVMLMKMSTEKDTLDPFCHCEEIVPVKLTLT